MKRAVQEAGPQATSGTVRPRVCARVRLAAALALGAALPLAVVATASSGEAARVIVVSTGAGDPVAARLIDELIAGGVTVEVTGEQTDPPAVLARARGARAVVRVEASRRAVRIWISGAAQSDTLSADAGGDTDTAARALALRVVEVLRPHLLPADTPTATATPVVAPWPPLPLPPPTADATAPAIAPSAVSSASARGTLPPPAPPPHADAAWPDSLSIYIAPTLLMHPTTSIAPSAGALWGVTKMLFPWAGVDVFALVPVVPGVLTTPSGKVKVATGAIGAGVLFRYPTSPSAFTGWLGAGIAAGFIGYDGEAANTAVRASDGVVAHALPYARAAIEWRAWPSLGVRMDVLLGLARPRPVLAIAGQPDTPLEEPLLGVSLGVLTWLP